MSSSRVHVAVRRLRPTAADLELPRYMTPGAAGLDLLADLVEELVVPPGGRVRVPTGLALALPPGLEGQVRPRSGLAWQTGLTVLNAPGTIDADYRGEIQVLLVNLGEEPATIRRGDRVAQLVVAPVTTVELLEVEVLPQTDRGAGGFGSTGEGSTR